MIKTRLTELLGIEHPIIEGGMSIAGNGELAAAVSNGGGLGVVSSNPGWAPVSERIENVRKHIRIIRTLTDKPFGANVPLQHIENFSDRHADMLIEERVPVVVTSGGNPRVLTAKLKAAGIIVGHVVGNVKQAIGAEKAGVDFVVCEGYEAGGIESPDELTSMVLTPLVAKAITVPLVAAGGFANGRGLLAALALGADGIQMGSAFLATTECHIHQNAKQAIVDSEDAATVMTLRTLGKLSRVMKTELTMKMVELDRRGAVEELKALVSAVPSAVEQIPGANTIGSHFRGQMCGDLVTGEIAAGQSIALVMKVQSAADLVRAVVQEAESTLAMVGGYVVAGRARATVKAEPADCTF